MTWSRRSVLLAAPAVAVGCVHRSVLAEGGVACADDVATPGAVMGPFPPTPVASTLRGQPNPGDILPISETDFDLTQVAAAEGAPVGQVVVVHGQILGAGCAPVAGADLLVWQADHAGQYNHGNEGPRVSRQMLDPRFGYWGRTQTDAMGRFVLTTIVPGAYPASRSWWRPPHLHWCIRAPGYPPLVTQSFFDGDALTGVAQIRDLNTRDLIRNIRGDFAHGLSGGRLDRARQQLQQGLTPVFAERDGRVTGELVFQLAS
jgi:protocatechuate 3,4-dioxygenase beta subunit